MGAALDGAKKAREDEDVKRLKRERVEKATAYFNEMKKERLSEVKRALHIIHTITGCRYNRNKNYIVLDNKYMQLRVFDEDAYPIALVESYSCQEWAHWQPITQNSGEFNHEVIKQSIDPIDIINYLAYLAGYSYPEYAEQIDSALADMDAYENSNKHVA